METPQIKAYLAEKAKETTTSVGGILQPDQNGFYILTQTGLQSLVMIGFLDGARAAMEAQTAVREDHEYAQKEAHEEEVGRPEGKPTLH